MKYSYTLLSNLIPNPPRFESKMAMRKHIELSTTEDDLEYGIIIDAGSRSFKFDSKQQLNNFLLLEDQDE